MQKEISTGLSIVTVIIAGSFVLPSCSKTQPTPATTVIVQAPAATESKGDSDKDKAAAEPTNRDVEDPPPSRKPAKKYKSQLLDFYDRLPAKHFAAFGGVNRRSLLNRKGAIVDYKHNFIEIPGSIDASDGDLRKLQITLFPNGDEPWCAVSRIVWPQDDTPGALDFYYGSSDSGSLRKVSEDFFPYPLQKNDMGYRSAWLPRRGLNIIVSTESEPHTGETYHYNRNFRVGEPAFTPVLESQ